MSLKYYDAASKIRQPNPKASYYADYAAMMDLGFENAPNVVYDEIEYEVTYGKEDFKSIDRVRVDTILNYNTGIILGDDYKTFIFAPEFPVIPYYGMKFRWQGSYWLVINTNSYASVPVSAEVRRCNNVLRFFDKNGERVYEPCIMDYTLRFANNEDTMTITVGNGEQKVWCQRNDRTKMIKANDRFLFGSPEQRVAFRLYGGGTKNYLNGTTMDDNSPTITEFYLDHYEINPDFDDLENGFADAYLNEVLIEFDEVQTQLSIGEQEILSYSVFKGKNKIDNVQVVVSSSDPSIISVSGNIITANSVGNASITITIDGTNISNTTEISVIDNPVVDEYEIVVSPNIDYLLQGQSERIYVYLYKNGQKQNNAVVFSNMTIDVPIEKYEIIPNDDNSFTLYNKGMYMMAPVIIRCSCGEYSKDLKIMLRGLY